MSPPPPGLYQRAGALQSWEAARPAGRGSLATEFTLDLNPPEITDAVREYAAPSFLPKRPLVEVLRDLASRILHRLHLPLRVYDDFHRSQRGAAGPRRGMPRFRQAGDRPARPTVWRLLSGYLATDPPPGRADDRRDATHAWASVWTPQQPRRFE